MTFFNPFSYGYHHNPNHPQHQQFYFSKPRYEIYPYSQEDIPPARHTSYGKPDAHGHTTVEIQQSQGYEIKEYPQEQPPAYGQHFVRFPGPSAPPPPIHEEVPVIVLKVPGPTKYAAHLKTLLQQYLEIRAAQVIRELEQQEHEAAAQIHAEQYHHQQQVQMYREPHRHHAQLHLNRQPNQELQTHVEYATPASVAAEQHAYHQYQQQQINGHTLSTAQTIVEEERPGHAVYGVAPSSPAPQEQHVQYEEHYEAAPQAGQTVYEDHQTHYVPAQQPSQAALIQDQEYYHQQAAYQHQEQRHQEQQQQQQELDHDPRHGGHIMYVTAEPHQPEAQQHFIYSTPSEQPGHHEGHNVHPTMVAVTHHGSQPGSHLETPENYPDEKHTRVVFTKNLAKGLHRHHHNHHRHHPAEQQMVLVATQETHAQDDRFHGPIYLPTQAAPHEEYGQEQASGHEQHQLVEEYQQPAAATPGPFITITQKRKMNRVPFNYHAHGRVSTPPPRKRETPFTEDQFNKFNKLVNRLKKKQMMLLTERTKKSPVEQEQSSPSSSPSAA